MTQEICGDFQRNKCFRATCRFLHPGSEGRTKAPTEVCKDFLANKCTRGQRCRFSHGQSEHGQHVHVEQPAHAHDAQAMMAAAYSGVGYGGYGVGYGGQHQGFGAYGQHYGISNPYDQQQTVVNPYEREFRTYRAPTAYGMGVVGGMGGGMVGGMVGGMGGGFPVPGGSYLPSHSQGGKEKCRDFLAGKCSRDNCRFDHSLEQCVDFLRGRCERGANCRFSHNKEPCRDFLYKGECKFGAECKFAHDSSAKQSSLPPCRDFLKGQCSYTKCKYRHDSNEVMGSKRTRDESNGTATGQPDNESRPNKQTKVVGADDSNVDGY